MNATQLDRLPRQAFTWHGLALHLGKRRKPILVLIADKTYPHLFRVQHPSGWTSTPANLSRAKDASYSHARHLLVAGTALEAPYSPEVEAA